jgi:uncharacterized protein YcfL
MIDMKKLCLIPIAIFLLLACASVASARSMIMVAGQGTETVNECAGYLVCQNFEGTGYDNSETWTEDTEGACTGCVMNEDYTTVHLRGDQSMLMTSGDAPSWSVTDFAAQSGVYGFVRLRVTNMPDIDNSDIVTVLSDYSGGAPTTVIAANIYANGNVRLSHLNADTELLTYCDTGAGTIAINTTYYVWWYGAKGTGSNGVAWVKFATTNEEPVSPACSVTDGKGIGNIIHAQVSTRHDSAYSFVTDQYLIKTSAIGSVPE